TGPSCAGNVGPQTVADRENARAVIDTEKVETAVIDRRKRLAVPPYASPVFLVPLGECARAEGETAAMHNHKIGIGANHRKAVRQPSPQDWRIILDLIVPACGAGIEYELRFLGSIDELEPEAGADPGIAV